MVYKLIKRTKQITNKQQKQIKKIKCRVMVKHIEYLHIYNIERRRNREHTRQKSNAILIDFIFISTTYENETIKVINL